jgi:hypothetical protein
VICDSLAKDFWNYCALTELWLPNQTFGDEKWTIWIEGKKLVYLDKQKLYAYTFSARTMAYWHRKYSLPPELTISIHWDACEMAMSKLPFGKRRWLPSETCDGLLWCMENGVSTRASRPR